ncbi:MAG: D-Ala-D-Ala carboxypeptidase family metallohydrolase [Thermoplasmata archaeon]
MHLTIHFTLEELDGANAPPDVRENLERLAALLEDCRALWGDRPVVVSSGYRSPDQNANAAGSKGSQHLTGEAADLHVAGLDAVEAWKLLLASNVQVGQAIVYGLDTYGGGPGTFLHVSLPNLPRGLVNDFMWTPAAGGSHGPYHRIVR